MGWCPQRAGAASPGGEPRGGSPGELRVLQDGPGLLAGMWWCWPHPSVCQVCLGGAPEGLVLGDPPRGFSIPVRGKTGVPFVRKKK